MKKVVIAMAIMMSASLMFTSCGGSEQKSAQSQEMSSAAEVDEKSKAEEEARKAAEEAEAAEAEAREKEMAAQQELRTMADKFYVSVFKRSRPDLSMLTSDFKSVVSRAASMWGNSPESYFECYFNISSDYGTENYTDKVVWEVRDVSINGESALVYLVIKGHYTGNSENGWHSVNDKIQFVKAGSGWQISDIQRDGRSIKNSWKDNPPLAA